MKFIDCLRLAKCNLLAYKRTAFLVMLGLLVSLVIMICCLAYNNSIANTMASITDSKISLACNVITDIDPHKDAALLDEIAAEKDVAGLQITYLCDIGRMIASPGSKSEKFLFTIGDTSLIAAGNEYPGTNDYTFDFPYEGTAPVSKSLLYVPFHVEALVMPYGRLFSDTELREYGRKYGGGSPLIGNEITGDKEIIISEYMMSKYGFTREQAKERIGQKIAIRVTDGKDSKVLFDGYTLVGILKTDFFRISSRSCSAQIFVPYSDALAAAQEDAEAGVNRFTTIVHSSNYSDAIRVNDSLKRYDKSVMLSSSAAVYADTEMQQTLYNKIILLVAALLIFAVIVYIYSIQTYYFYMRRSYIGLERAVGMRPARVFLVFLCEFVLMSSSAFVLSVPCSLGLITVLRAFLTQIIGYGISITARDFLPAAILGGVFVLLVSLLLSFLIFRKAKRDSILECLADTL